MIELKLQQARLQLQELNLKKSGVNGHTGFKYFELADFIPSVNALFFDLQIFSKFNLAPKMATLTLVDIEDKSSVVFYMPTAEIQLKGCNAVQAIGGQVTYCKRYLYMNALELVEDDIFDKETNPQKPEAAKAENKPTNNVTDFVNAMKEYGFNKVETAKFCHHFGIVSAKPETLDAFFAKYQTIDAALEEYNQGKEKELSDV